MINENNIKIGLEVHALITAATHKAFSSASNSYTDTPNSFVDLLDIGMPGSLPVLNHEVVMYAVRTALSLNMDVNRIFKIDRKIYWSEDLPLGYQLTQFFQPIGINGYLKFSDLNIRIKQMHIETDAAKIVNDNDQILVDHNRSVCPLVEIVTEPDFKNANEVIAFLKMLRSTLRYIEVCDCKMELGHFRVDVNISVNNGNRVEIKNLNSDDAIRKAIHYETKRHLEAIYNDTPVKCETRAFNDGTTVFLRLKETAEDYMYFRDPDLPTYVIDTNVIEEEKKKIHKLPTDLYESWHHQLNMRNEDIEVLLKSPHIIKFMNSAFENQDINIQKIIVRLVLVDIFSLLNNDNLEKIPIDVQNIQELAIYVKENKPNSMIIKTIIEKMWSDNISPSKIIEQLSLGQIDDREKISKLVDEVINDNTKEVQQHISGQKNLIGFFVGKIMKQTNNRITGKLLTEILHQKLESMKKDTTKQ